MGKNLIVIISDEHLAPALGCAGHEFIQTPHLDKLAARGKRFETAYTPSPICVPARAAFASGQYVHQTGHWDNASPYTGTPKGWGHQLQANGTQVESIGKLHYRHVEDDSGFDKLHIPMLVKDGIGMVWGSIRNLEERLLRTERMLGDTIGPGDSSYTNYDRNVTNRTMDWLREHKDTNEGWCLYVGLVAPHFPLVVPQEFYDLYKDRDFTAVKAHPDDGYIRHPWIEQQNGVMNADTQFKDDAERHAAHVAYYGLISWLDHNIGQIMGTLDETGLTENTTVIYSSDHGDNVGARGLWGKSNMYEEAAAIPMIMAGPDISPGICKTPVSLLDISATIPSYFGLTPEREMIGTDLRRIADAPEDKSRVIFSEYHAVGAVTGAFMIRKGNWKLIHYVNFEPELFNLDADPEELTNQAGNPIYADKLAELTAELHNICDPEAVDARAHADQRAMVDALGGLEAARHLGPKGATPPPEVT
jgi:choline-sulfatase